jgi:hypothetical protein
VRLVHDPRELSRVMTVRFIVTGVLQMVSEPILAVSPVRMGQGCGYICMTHGSSRRDTVRYICC